ncbi:hypothetical protein CC86DRAFT_413470 [Ophiobolus disseminans]|uniref:Uncharacterized protein n=1 Tax=Ophiobolus disseminans TaxID=1469910 RepID=A0A6A6ZD78_9PLEO|nr:hypothetical protein CC86DRAFT_413470 [Ophiobolus disseminans]
MSMDIGSANTPSASPANTDMIGIQLRFSMEDPPDVVNDTLSSHCRAQLAVLGAHVDGRGYLDFVLNPNGPLEHDKVTLELVFEITRISYNQAAETNEALVQHRASFALDLQQGYYDT